MKDTFGKASRVAQALAHARPNSMTVEPLEHWRTCGSIRAEVVWTVDGIGAPPLAVVKLTADHSAVRLRVETDGEIGTLAARELARILARANAAAAELEKILKER